MLFMLFFVYNTALWAESEWIWSVLANGFSTNNLLDTRQETIMVISLKKKQKKKQVKEKINNFTVDRDHSYKK